MKILLISFLFLLNFFLLPDQEKTTIRVANQPTIKGEAAKIISVATGFNDTIDGDTLYLQITAEGLPQAAYRKIGTSVCVDNQCRPLQIVIYWDITGRYLGFELPPGEFLSRKEHSPFTETDYLRLHSLLANPYSSLANYKLEELIPQKKNQSPGVDAISSATIKDVLNSVVEGAVYTTYTIWHIVYGNSQKEVQKLGVKYFSEDLAMHILNSQDIDGQIWILNQLVNYKEWSEDLQGKVLSLINNQNFYLSERAINSFSPKMMASMAFQDKLYEVFMASDYSVRRLIILKLSKSAVLSEELKTSLAAGLSQYKGPLAQNVLDLFIAHKVTDLPTCLNISELLSDKNRFLARKAFNYLDQLSIEDRKIKKRMKVYRSN